MARRLPTGARPLRARSLVSARAGRPSPKWVRSRMRPSTPTWVRSRMRPSTPTWVRSRMRPSMPTWVRSRMRPRGLRGRMRRRGLRTHGVRRSGGLRTRSRNSSVNQEKKDHCPVDLSRQPPRRQRIARRSSVVRGTLRGKACPGASLPRVEPLRTRLNCRKRVSELRADSKILVVCRSVTSSTRREQAT